MESAVIARPLVEFLLSPGKILSLVRTLFGLKRTLIICMNLNICIQIKLFPKFPQQNCSFTFSPFLLDYCKSGRELAKLLSQPTFLTCLTYLTYPTYLTYLSYLTYLTYLPNLFKTRGTVRTHVRAVNYRMT